jgi:hypothetical protein
MILGVAPLRAVSGVKKLAKILKKWAGDGIRTRDVQLGKWTVD